MVNEDYRDILLALVKQHARFLVVGAHAMAAHGYPRATVDIDLWIEPSPENAEHVWQALAEFGAPLEALDVTRDDFVRPDVVVQLGLPPNRVDILTGVSGLGFEPAWRNRIDAVVDGVHVPVLSMRDLIENKRATGRDKDRVDIKGLKGET